MKKIDILKTGLYSLGIAAATTSAAEKELAKKPNVIFFIADDMRPYMFNCLPEGKDNNLTPNIDRLAAGGTILMGQHVASPLCTPSRYNVLTGRYASRATNVWFQMCRKDGGQTVVEFNSHITPKNVTFPKLLQKNGYTTGFVGKNHVVEVKNLYKFPDFDASAKDPENIKHLKENEKKVQDAIKECGFDFAENVYHNNPDFIGLSEVAVQNMDWITQGGVNFIDKYHDKPFFLYIATTVPHGPEEAPRSWDANPLITPVGYLDKPLTVQPPRKTIPERLKKAGLRLNNDRANMLWLDDGLGALIKRLEKYGILDNTIIFFFNDHGQDAKGTLYQGGIYDPSIVWRNPKFKCGHILNALVSNVDFAPTILDMTNSSYKVDQFNGKTFLPYLNGEKQAPRVLYSELGYSRAIRKGNWKLLAVSYPEVLEKMSDAERKELLEKWNKERKRKHLNIVTTDYKKPFSHLTPIPGGGDAEHESTGAYPGYYDKYQLYDLSKDPGEQKNLANNPEFAPKLEEMKLEMKKILDTLPGKFADLSDGCKDDIDWKKYRPKKKNN
jgi:arylsulfatase A-like enzyme